MARRDQGHRDRRRSEYEDRRRYEFDDPYDRDEGENYGQYGNLHRGLGYGGGRDPENLSGYGRGRDPDRYPRGGGGRHEDEGRYGEEERGPRWQGGRGPGWQDESRGRGPADRPGRGGERGLGDRAADEVASWFGDEDAARRREADHRGKGPRGYRRSDERIQDDVNDRLTDDPDVDATDITVSVQDGEVTLSGQVDSRRAKRAAEDCADSVSGVTHVQNNLRIRPAQG